jgi:arylsulfatase A-like enzyme
LAPTWFPADRTETAFLTEALLGWLDAQAGGPSWFAHVSYLRPHPPYRAPAGYHDRYDPDEGPGFRRNQDRAAELALHPLHEAAAHVTGCPTDERELRKLRAAYWGNMAEVDDQVGRVLDHLERRGLAEDTLVVLTSDHGDQMGDHWLLEKLGWWDESYHIPLLVADPRPAADATRGSVVDAFTESVDVLPTICDWLGVETPVEVDGRSLRPFLHAGVAPADWRSEVHWQWDYRDPVHHLAEDLFGLTMEQCAIDVVRGHDHKYVHLASGESLYFDLREDPDQLIDRCSMPTAQAEVSEARARLLDWRMRHDDRTLTGHRLTAASGLVVRRDPRR